MREASYYRHADIIYRSEERKEKGAAYICTLPTAQEKMKGMSATASSLREVLPRYGDTRRRGPEHRTGGANY